MFKMAMSVADVIEQLNARLSDSGDESTQEPDPMPMMMSLRPTKTLTV